MSDKKRIAIILSGRGSNMMALVEHAKAPDFPATIDLVVSNRGDAPGLHWANEQGIYTRLIAHKDFENKTAFEDAIIDALNENAIDMVCLAGFMRILSPYFFTRWTKPVLNIHPSLLPKHKGLHTHEAVLEANETEHGCTVHFVTEELDAGDIIVQRKVPVLSGDTADTLAARVLVEEHQAYAEAIRTIAARD